MNAILIKILAMGLALAQVTTTPDNVKTVFDANEDQAEVVRLLGEGCTHMRKVFDIEDIKLDDLIATAMEDSEAVSGSIEALRGLKFDDLITVYRQYCKQDEAGGSVVDIGELISFYNAELYDLPDHANLKEQAMRTMTVVLDQKGERFADIGDPVHRRTWVSLNNIPPLVRKAFVAAEDKRFYEHGGIDERGMIRALVGNMADPGRPQGGSTITQQVAKNLLVGSGVTFERKLREIILASRIEQDFSKDDILEIYLNSIYFGRGVWGIEMASKSYFDKPAKNLTLREGAMLAALIKGPAYFNPDRYPQRVQGRLRYVLQRMVEDSVITPMQMQQALAQELAVIEPQRRDSGFAFMDYVVRETEATGRAKGLAESPYTIRSTILPELQVAVESALQEGLARYERNSGRYEFKGPEANLAEAIARVEKIRGVSPRPAAAEEGAKDEDEGAPSWLVALKQARLPLYDVHWSPAIVTNTEGEIKVGLTDGRVLPLRVPNAKISRSLQLNDVVLVRVEQSRKSKTPYAEIRIRPVVQGAAIALENKTGRILAMTGGFSYPLSQLNRATQSWRQPGSALKPVTYLAALKAGMRPSSPVMDTAITLAPITGNKDYWSPKNYSGRGSGQITLQKGLERSRNLATVHLLDGGIAPDPKDSLDKVCEVALQAELYAICEPFYPFVLGAQPVRVIDLAAFYTAIANEGVRPAPYSVEQITKGGRVVYRHQPVSTRFTDVQSANFYELKMMLQGVVARGTASTIRSLSPYVAGKTGTSNDAADAWFVGFTNDVTVAVWVGYDNADGQRRSLGGHATGNSVAAPIFAEIMQGVWTHYGPREELTPPSKEVKKQIAALDAAAVGRSVVGLDNQYAVPKVRRARQAEPFFVFEGRRQRWREGRRGGLFGFFGRTNRVR